MVPSWRSIRLSILLPIFLFLLLAHEPLSAQAPASFFYYYQGQRVPLTLDTSRVAARFAPGLTPSIRAGAARGTGEVESVDQQIDTGPLGVSILNVRPGHDPQAAVAGLKGRPEVRAAGRVFAFPGRVLYAETEEFIVRFKPGLTASEIEARNRASGVEIARAQPFSKDVLILRPRPGNRASALDLANSYVENGWVDFAEPNFVMIRPEEVESAKPATAPAQAAPPPNDAYFSYQWALKNTGQFQGSQAGADINALEGWGLSKGSNTVKIAIIDEGVDATHSDLQGKVLLGYNALDGNVNTQPNANDHHGTAAAGLAAAKADNAFGIAGVCWFCQILPVKIAYEDANGAWSVTTPAIIADGIEWAWQHGADVLSNSWVMTGPSDTVTIAILDAYSGGRGGYGSSLVFAAGNDGTGTVSFPARLDNVIAVGATNWCDQRKTSSSIACNDGFSWGSNYGPALDIVAPGMYLLTTCNGSLCVQPDPGVPYTYFSGTSGSTPLVAGAVGLLYAVNPKLTPSEVRRALVAGSKHLPPTSPDTGAGYNRLDTAGAIKALYGLSIGIRKSVAGIAPGDMITYTLRYTNTGMTDIPASTLAVTLSPGLAYVGSSLPFTGTNGVYQANLGTLYHGVGASQATFTAQVEPGTEGQTLTLQAQISSDYEELNTSDNYAVDTAKVAKYAIFLPLLLK